MSAAMAAVIPPPYQISEHDRRGLVAVITATTLSFVWTCLFIRLWLRFKPTEWKLDDLFLFAATILDTVVAAFIFHVLEAGLGQSRQSDGAVLSDSTLSKIAEDDLKIHILYILTLLLSKCAVLFLYQRLSPRKGHTIASWVALGASIVWAIMSIVLVAAPCNADHVWRHGFEQCSGLIAKWRAIAILDILTETAIFSISIYLVAKLNMKFQSKALVVGAFSLRIPVIAASATRLYYLSSFLSSSDPPLEAASYIACTQTHLGYAIISTTLAGLGPFLRPFTQSPITRSSSYLHSNSKLSSHISRITAPGIHTVDEPNHAESYTLTPMKAQAQKGCKSPSPDQQRLQTSDYQQLRLRPERDLVRQKSAVLGGGGARGAEAEAEDVGSSRHSDDSQRMIITKKMEFTVEMDAASLRSRGEGGNRMPQGRYGD